MDFMKFRLSSLVVISALSGYLFVGGDNFTHILYLILGGMLVTAASNGSNQIWERETDKLMKRTQNRPLPTGAMSVREGIILVVISLFSGLTLLYLLNFQTAFFGLLSFIAYVFIYTPLKKISPWAVFVGAFPGAMPPLLGAVAYTGEFGLVPGILFLVQFIWQFPHFWAIAWVVFDDYKSAGFHLLPSQKGKSKESAYQIALYAFLLIPISLTPWLLGMTGITTLVVATIIGAIFFWYSYKLLLTCDDKDARKLMFASFVYLPIIQFLYVLDRADLSAFLP
jgi:protoheme IX farnesyltransferase